MSANNSNLASIFHFCAAGPENSHFISNFLLFFFLGFFFGFFGRATFWHTANERTKKKKRKKRGKKLAVGQRKNALNPERVVDFLFFVVFPQKFVPVYLFDGFSRHKSFYFEFSRTIVYFFNGFFGEIWILFRKNLFRFIYLKYEIYFQPIFAKTGTFIDNLLRFFPAKINFRFLNLNISLNGFSKTKTLEFCSPKINFRLLI